MAVWIEKGRRWKKEECGCKTGKKLIQSYTNWKYMEITLENLFYGLVSSVENQYHLLLVKYSLKTRNNYHNTYFRYKNYFIKKLHDILVFGGWNYFNNDHPIGRMCSSLLLPYDKRALINRMYQSVKRNIIHLYYYYYEKY